MAVRWALLLLVQVFIPMAYGGGVLDMLERAANVQVHNRNEVSANISCEIELVAWGIDDTELAGHVKLNDEVVYNTTGWPTIAWKPRGFNVATLAHCEIEGEFIRYDTYETFSASRELRDFINGLPGGTTVVGVTVDEATWHLDPARTALEELGLNTQMLSYRGSMAFVATKGMPESAQVVFADRHDGPAVLIAHMPTGIGGPEGPEVPESCWSTMPKHALYGHNDLDILDDSSVNECKEACAAAVECRSFDRTSRSCYLSSQTSSSQPGDFGQHSDATYFEKTCNED